MRLNTLSYLKYYLARRPVFMSLIRAKEAALFSYFRKYLKSPVLDVGCGDGEFARMVWGQLATGIDLPGSRMTESYQAYQETKEFNGINIPYPKNHFSTAVSNCVLEHVHDLGPLLTEIHRVVKPGGSFLTTVMAKPWEDGLLGARIFGQFYTDWFRKTQDHQNLLTQKEWHQLFDQTGWQVIQEVGYLPSRVAHWIEIWHYLSIGYLISYKLTGRWTWLNPAKFLPVQKLDQLIQPNTDPAKSCAIFYVLKKSSKDIL